MSSGKSQADNRTSDRDERRRWRLRFGVTLALASCVALFLVAQLGRLRVDNDVEHWLSNEDNSTRILDWFLEFVPARERVYISWQSNSLEDPRTDSFVAALRDRADVIDDVVNPAAIVDAMVEQRIERAEAVNRLRGYLVGQDEKNPRLGLLAFIQNEAGKKPRSAIRTIEEAARECGIPANELSLAGSVRIRAQLNTEVDHVAFNPDAPAWRLDQRSTLLTSVAVALLLTIVLVRRLLLSLLILGTALAGMIATLGVIPLTDGALNIVLLVMPTLVFVITLSGAIHVVNYFRAADADRPAAAAAEAQHTALGPCLLASTTTAIGLASLTISPLTPVRQFGFYAAIGAGVAFVLAIFVVPSLLWLFVGTITRLRPTAVAGLSRLAFAAVSKRRVLVFAGWLLLALGAANLASLRTESRIIQYFPADSPIGLGYRDIESHISGIAPVEALVVLDQSVSEELRFRERLELIRAVSRAVDDVPEVTGSLCLADFVPEVPQPPASAPFLQKARWHRVGSEMEKRVRDRDGSAESVFWREVETSSDFASEGDEIWGISTHVTMLPDELDFGDLLSEMERAIQTTLPPEIGAKVYVTGTVPQLLRVQKAVLDSLVISFVAAFGVIAVVLAVVLRDVVAAGLLMLPNLLPVVSVFGLLAWLKIPVDIGTMLTASVALGIAVDDSVHLLIGYRNRVRDGMPIHEAISESLCHSGMALVQTTVVISSGLLVLGGSDMRLISQFGLVMAGLLCLALVADLVLLPAMLAGTLGRRIANAARPSAGEAEQIANGAPSTAIEQAQEATT